MLLFMIGLLLGIIITCIYNRLKVNTQNIQLAPSGKRLIEIVENSRDGFYHLEVKPTCRFLGAHPPFEVTFGEEKGRLVYDNPDMAFERVHPDDKEILYQKLYGETDYSKPVIYRIAMGDEAFQKGEYTLFEEYTTPVYDDDGELVAIQGVLRDITEKAELEKELEYRITHDCLTDLYNREFFERQMSKYENEEDIAVGIIIIDLDNLKLMNDTFGHRQGDQLIKEAANVLKTYSTDKVLISRVGGDEFVILVLDTNLDEVEQLVERIRAKVEYYNEQHEDMSMQLSIGYAFNERSIHLMEILYVEADRMMYDDKRKKKIPEYKIGQKTAKRKRP